MGGVCEEEKRGVSGWVRSELRGGIWVGAAFSFSGRYNARFVLLHYFLLTQAFLFGRKGQAFQQEMHE